MLQSKDLLGLQNTSKEEIEEIVSLALDMRKKLNSGEKKLPDLREKSVVTLFYENSTRTRVSFEFAAKFLSAAVVNISAAASSVAKGESLIDTGKTLDAMGTDVIVIRHSMGGAPELLAKNVKAAVINAGDGVNEHPTQALLDMTTMQEHFGSLKGLRVAILGDIKHSRVAKSNIFGLNKMGASVTVYGPSTLIPQGVEQLGCTLAKSREDAIRGADVVMGLRIQLERQKGGLFPSLSEYHKFYGVDKDHLALANSGAIVMHPGPVNRGVELSGEVIDGENSYIEDQVLSGVAVRMALLKLLCENRRK